VPKKEIATTVFQDNERPETGRYSIEESAMDDLHGTDIRELKQG
jgi:hypothetical protein